MTQQELINVARNIMLQGPARVLINASEAVPSYRARLDHGVIPDIIFIRNDGWSLGAPYALELEAWGLWPKEWVAYMRRPYPGPRPIEIYKPITSQADSRFCCKCGDVVPPPKNSGAMNSCQGKYYCDDCWESGGFVVED